jgi:hypothetical protein
LRTRARPFCFEVHTTYERGGDRLWRNQRDKN